MLHVWESRGTVDQTVERLTMAVEAHKFGVLGVIDLKAKMVAKGVTFSPECRILEVCNPHQAKIVLESNMAVSTALPCRICVYEEGGKVKVATLKPTALIGQFGSPELEPVARDVEAALLQAINQACK
jgi:uncharacterized protein (DUF302 family)